VLEPGLAKVTVGLFPKGIVLPEAMLNVKRLEDVTLLFIVT